MTISTEVNIGTHIVFVTGLHYQGFAPRTFESKKRTWHIEATFYNFIQRCI